MNNKPAPVKIKTRARIAREYTRLESERVKGDFKRLQKRCGNNGKPRKADMYAVLWAVSQMFGKEIHDFYKKGHYNADSYRLAAYSACTFLGMTPYRIAMTLNITLKATERYINSIANDMDNRTTFIRVRIIGEYLDRLKGKKPTGRLDKVSFRGKGHHK